MLALLALLPTIVSGVSSGISAVKNGIALISAIREAAKQSGDWDESHEALFQEALLATKSDPAWQPDAPV